MWFWSIILVWFKSIVISIHIFCKTNFLQEQGSIFSHQEICLQNEKVKVWHGKVNNSDYWRPKVNDKFDSVWNNILDKAQHTVAMEQNLENYDLGLNNANVKILKKNTYSVIKSYKCNQCGFASSYAGNLRRHLKTHSGEKQNKCNQCDFASSHADNLRTHLKMHSGEKSNKCNQCDYASSQASHLRTHLKNAQWRKIKQV